MKSDPARDVAPLILASGAVATLLLPVGSLLGTGKSHIGLFDLIAVLHGILQVAALVTTLLFLKQLASKSRPAGAIVALALIIALPAIALVGSVPITARDALIHHLAVPKLWLEHGFITEIPGHEWSYYPMLVELGFTALLKYNLLWLVPYYHASYLFLLGGVAALFIEREGGSSVTSALSFFLLLTLPIAIKLATIPDVDLGLALYSMTAILYLAAWMKKEDARSLLGMGVSLGLAMGTKYNGLLATVVAGLTALFFGSRAEKRPAKLIPSVAAALVVAAVVFSPWAVKNISYTNNPLYPLYNSYFNPKPSMEKGVGGLSPVAHRMVVGGESLFDIVTTPLRMLVTGEDENPYRFDGRLTPLFILAVFPILYRRNTPWVVALTLFCAAYFLLAQFFAAPRVRYLAPIFGTVAVLSAFGFEVIRDRLNSKFVASSLLILALGVQTVWSVVYLKGLIAAEDAWRWAKGGVTREEYLAQHLREYRIIQAINREVPKDAPIYLMFTGNKFFLFDRKTISTGHFSGQEFIRWLDVGGSVLARHTLKQSQARYVFVNEQLLSKAIKATELPRIQDQWNEFKGRHLGLRLQDREFVVYEIVDSPALREEVGSP